MLSNKPETIIWKIFKKEINTKERRKYRKPDIQLTEDTYIEKQYITVIFHKSSTTTSTQLKKTNSILVQ